MNDEEIYLQGLEEICDRIREIEARGEKPDVLELIDKSENEVVRRRYRGHRVVAISDDLMRVYQGKRIASWELAENLRDEDEPDYSDEVLGFNE